MEETTQSTQNTGEGRDEHGKWLPGVSGNPEGAKPWTEEQKLEKKATKQLIKEYQEKLAEALVKIEPVLVAKAIEGDVQAIKELHDRAMGKARQVVGIEGGEEGSPIKIAKEVADKYEKDSLE